MEPVVFYTVADLVPGTGDSTLDETFIIKKENPIWPL